VVAPERANVPLSIQELLEYDIPFIGSDVGGIHELMSDEDSNTVLFAPRSDKLADKLFSVLNKGIKIVTPLIDSTVNKQLWMNWHSNLRTVVVDGVAAPNTPLVSVVITHYNRPEYLRQAIASIENQDYANLEVILVDDASNTPEALQEIKSLGSLFQKRGWKIIVHKENSYLGKARNTGVENARGKYVLFLDDDNVAKESEVSTFVIAAENGGADILTSVMDVFHGDSVPAEGSNDFKRRVPLGGDVATGFFWNCFGDANSFVKKSSFLSMGGFTEDYQVGYEDYEFFARAVLKGFHLEVVPESLFWYRKAYDTMSHSTPLYKNRMRYIRPYLEHLPAELSNLFLYVQSMHYEPESPFLGAGAGICNATNCTDCLKLSGCGWCNANNLCLPGNASGAMDKNCSGMGNWTYGPNATCCDAYSDCKACFAKKECGWCDDEKKCMTSDDKGNVYFLKSKCHKNAKTTAITAGHGSCSSSSTSKKTLIIAVAVSVGGALILLAIAAIIIYIIYTRAAKHSGYTPINQG